MRGSLFPDLYPRCFPEFANIPSPSRKPIQNDVSLFEVVVPLCESCQRFTGVTYCGNRSVDGTTQCLVHAIFSVL